MDKLRLLKLLRKITQSFNLFVILNELFSTTYGQILLYLGPDYFFAISIFLIISHGILENVLAVAFKTLIKYCFGI